MALPAELSQLTPEWLTTTLRDAGVIGANETVTRVTEERLGEGVGFIGVVGRLRLTYADGAGSLPSLIAKLPSPDEGARTIGNMYGLYEREVRFYTDVAASVGIATPRAWYAAWDADAGQSLILLEDLGPTGTIGDQVAGCAFEHAELAIRNLAAFHANWCDAAKLASISWLQDGVELVRTSMTEAYDASVGLFLELFGKQLHSTVRAIIPGLNERVMRMLDTLVVEERLTAAHGDYRLDNMFFGQAGAPYELAVIDWQSINRGWGAYDLAYFMSGSFPNDQRRQYEQKLLRRYHEALTASGRVPGYSLEQLFDDYRRSLLVYLAIFVINGATLEMTNERAVALFNVIFDRLNDALLDLQAVSLLPA